MSIPSEKDALGCLTAVDSTSSSNSIMSFVTNQLPMPVQSTCAQSLTERVSDFSLWIWESELERKKI